MISSNLNQIFYRHNKFDNPDSIALLSSYFLTLTKKNEIMLMFDSEKDILCQKQLEFIQQPLLLVPPPSLPLPLSLITQSPVPPTSIDSIDKSRPSTTPASRPHKKSYYEPTQTDSLFWCIYINVYGYNDYLQIGHRYGNSELAEKQKVIEFLKKEPKKIKDSNHKVTKSLTEEIISEFMVMNNQTTFEGIIALSIYYNISIYIVNKQKNIYLKYAPNDYNGLPIVIYKTQKRYTTEMESTQDIITHIQDTMLCLETIHKPLKSISNYKSNDLFEIVSKLKIEIPADKVKKGDVYRKICEYCII